MNIEGRHKKKRISNVEGMYSACRELPFESLRVKRQGQISVSNDLFYKKD